MSSVLFSREGRRSVVIEDDNLEASALRLCKGDAEQAQAVVRRVRNNEKVQIGAVTVVRLVRQGDYSSPLGPIPTFDSPD